MIRQYMIVLGFCSSLVGIQEGYAVLMSGKEELKELQEQTSTPIQKSENLSIPTQKDQINAYIKFSQRYVQKGYETSEEYTTLKEISQKNFAILMETIKNRFPEDGLRFAKASAILDGAMKVFDSGTMNLKQLTNIYFNLYPS